MKEEGFMTEEMIQTKQLPVQGKDMDSIMKNLETGVSELFTSDRYQEYLRTMSKFHNYSFNNTMLIAMQRPDATLVTGYRNWQSMGRQVKKGEKGITIIAPAPVKRKREQEVRDENQNPVLGTDGKPKMEEVEITLPCFKAITVFDIGQTTGEPIQTLTPELLTAAVEEFDFFMNSIRDIAPVPIKFSLIEGTANGYYQTVDKEIVIREGMSQSQTLKTAIHETVHSILHDKDMMEDRGMKKDRLTKEVEAESVAYCVCSAFGLDTSDYSFPYIVGWSSGKEMKELKASMDVIRETAGEFIDQLTERLEHYLENKRGILIDAVEAAGYRFLEEDGKYLQFTPDGTHQLQGHLYAKSWNEVRRWMEDIAEKGDPIQKERVARVLYPERFQKSYEEMMFEGKDCRLSIYQIDENGSGRNQLFMGMEYIKEKRLEVRADQYECVYSSLYLPNEDLNAIYSIFNDNPPADYKAHSLSVSDVVILNQNGDLKAYFVDRFGFQELPEFVGQRMEMLNKKPLEKEIAYWIPESETYLYIQKSEEGYDYTFYDKEYRNLDGGIYENAEKDIRDVANELVVDYEKKGEKQEINDLDAFLEMVDEAGQKELEQKVVEAEENLAAEDLLERYQDKIRFYAVECSEFPVLGEAHMDLSLKEALEVYEQIPGERMNGLKAVGFNLQENGDYDGMMDLLVAGKMQDEYIGMIPYLRDHKLVKAAMKQVESYMEEKHPTKEKTIERSSQEKQQTKAKRKREDMSL